MKTLKVKVTLTEEMLGMSPGNREVATEFITSRSADAAKQEEEDKALSAREAVEKAKTVFPRDDDGTPILWDYQIKGSFKDAAGMLNRIGGTESVKLKAYRKVIDGLVFVGPRKIRLNLPAGGTIGECQRPLRAMTMQGERVSLAVSETIPAGTTFEFTVTLMGETLKASKDSAEPAVNLDKCVREWLDYAVLRGYGQWRNSGKGRATWEEAVV